MLHEDCIENCCWGARLEAAGGPTPITWAGILSALENRTLRSNDSGEVEFMWERLPSASRADLDRAEQARLTWEKAVLNGTSTRTVRSTSDRSCVRPTPELKACVQVAVELGAKSPEGVADWLGIPPDDFAPGWFTRAAVDHLIRQGYSNPEIVKVSETWGHPVNYRAVLARRRRLVPDAEVEQVAE